MLEFFFGLLILISHASLLPHYDAPLDYYYISISLALALMLLIGLIKRGEYKIHLSDILIFSSVSLLGYFTHDVKSLWLDEYTQILSSSRVYDCLTCSSAIEQQTPLSYGLLSFAQSIFSTSVFGVRLFPALFLAGSCVYLKRVLIALNTRPILVVLAIFLYLFNFQTYYFFSEVKPYSLFLYCSLWTFSLFLKSINEKQGMSISHLLPALFFLSMSIGLQAQLFIAALLIAHVLSSAREMKGEIILTCVGALLLSLPIIWNIYEWSQVFNQFHTSYSFQFSTLLAALENYFLGSTQFLTVLTFEVYVGLALFGVALFFNNPKIRYLLLTFIIFSLLFFSAYSIFINWKLLLKYHLISIVMVLIAVFCGYEFGLRRLSWAWPRWFKVILIAVISLRLSFYLLNFENQTRLFTDSRALPWKTFYHELQEVVTSEDVVYFLSFKAMGEWYQSYPIAMDFYVPKDAVKTFNRLDMVNLPSYENSSASKGDIFIVSAQTWSSDTIDDDLIMGKIPSLSIQYLSGIRVFKLESDGRSRNERLIGFFKTTLSLYGEFSWSVPIWASLAQMYKITANKKAHLEAMKQLKLVFLPRRKNEDGASVDRETMLRLLIQDLSFD